MIPPDEEREGELNAITYEIVNAKGCNKIEENTEMKKRLQRRPDKADSLMLAFASTPEGEEVSVDSC